MSGCVAQLYGKTLKRHALFRFCSCSRIIPQIPKIINNIRSEEKNRPIETSMDVEDVFDISPYHQEGKKVVRLCIHSTRLQ